MKVNVEHLKADLKSECLGAYFGGGFGAALVSYSDVENASTEKLLQMAGLCFREQRNLTSPLRTNRRI